MINKIFRERQRKRRDEALSQGARDGKVFPYPKELIDRLRPYHYGGMPLSILVLINELCNGKCYNTAIMMSLAIDDAKIVHADIESLRHFSGKKSAEHAFIETQEFGGDRTWVIDTSTGLVYDKEFYYKLEKPKVNMVFSKEEIMASPVTKSILACDFEKDKFALTLTLPIVEMALEQSLWLGTVIYKDFTKQEVQKLKDAIGYDAMQAEIDEDIKLIKTNPALLDEKFGIVRDSHGRVMSRGGVPDPYYISYEDAVERDRAFQEACKDPETYKKYMAEILNESLARMEEEEKETERRARQKLAEVQKNPTANVYDREPQSE